MARYILGRIPGLVMAFIMVSIITFSLMHSVPGGPFDEEKQPLPPEAKANILRKYGLDRAGLRAVFALHVESGPFRFWHPISKPDGNRHRFDWPGLATHPALGPDCDLFSFSFGLLLGNHRGDQSEFAGSISW